MRGFWSWLTDSKTWLHVPEPDVIAVPSDCELAERLDAVKLLLLTALDKQDTQWPDDRNAEVIDLAVDVLRVLGVELVQPERGELPVIPGRSS